MVVQERDPKLGLAFCLDKELHPQPSVFSKQYTLEYSLRLSGLISFCVVLSKFATSDWTIEHVLVGHTRVLVRLSLQWLEWIALPRTVLWQEQEHSLWLPKVRKEVSKIDPHIEKAKEAGTSREPSIVVGLDTEEIWPTILLSWAMAKHSYKTRRSELPLVSKVWWRWSLHTWSGFLSKCITVVYIPENIRPYYDDSSWVNERFQPG